MKYLIITISLGFFACATTPINHDEIAAQQTIIEMVNAIDSKKWNHALKRFDGKVFVDYSSMTGQAGTDVASKDLVEGWKNLLKKVDTHHMLSNFVIKKNRDNIEAFSHVYASHTSKGIPHWDIYGQYHHKLKKTPDGWKIIFMKLTVYGQKGNLSFLEQLSKQQ